MAKGPLRVVRVSCCGQTRLIYSFMWSGVCLLISLKAADLLEKIFFFFTSEKITCLINCTRSTTFDVFAVFLKAKVLFWVAFLWKFVETFSNEVMGEKSQENFDKYYYSTYKKKIHLLRCLINFIHWLILSKNKLFFI